MLSTVTLIFSTSLLVIMGSKPVSISKRVIKFLDKNPTFKLGDVQDEYEPKDSEAVRSAFRRWHKARTPPETSGRSDHISENGQNSDQDGSAGKQRNTPVSLTKLDEPSYERYLLSVANNSDPSINIAREIRSWLDIKDAIKKEESVKTEIEEKAFMETVKRAKSYIPNIEKEISK